MDIHNNKNVQFLSEFSFKQIVEESTELRNKRSKENLKRRNQNNLLYPKKTRKQIYKILNYTISCYKYNTEESEVLKNKLKNVLIKNELPFVAIGQIKIIKDNKERKNPLYISQKNIEIFRDILDVVNTHV